MYKPKKRSLPLNGAAWRKLRAQVLAEQPLCPICEARGQVVPAVHVDHIHDSRDDYSDDNRRENLIALCHECHSMKTAQDMGKKVYWGCSVDGWPLDPKAPWNFCRYLPEKSPATEPPRTAPPVLF